jgi:acetyl-CoA carboxylase biotin carboxylase subunit
MFKKILIANRGEIAVRVIRSAKKMGIKTVAVYSDADKEAMHVKMADEAYYIGASPANESYLVQEKIIEVAKATKSEAIHPGYGFLSENASFSELCKQEGIEFIGPSADAIRTMGDKITARKTMIAAGVPVVPGLEDFSGSDEELIRFAEQVGFPVMVKASAGGGGKGMRLVHKAEELIDAVRMAKGEAKSAFGDDTVYIEKFVSSPHHIEFQVLADKFGNAIHINERECSVQRRHQKVIEETPSPLMTTELRKKMGEAAVQATKAVNYVGAGTIEFLVDDELNFYFLEMNTRLQVEHPITEMTSGLDLVEEQIKIAYGEHLKYKQEDIKQNGHAIECRIYAEDTENNFMPSAGKVLYIKEPQGKNIRIDGYVYSGYTIPIYYDPMISKLIVWDHDRKAAIEKMKEALKNYRIIGVKNNIAYLHKVLEHPKFVEGKYDTRFVGLYGDDLAKISYQTPDQHIKASVIAYIDHTKRANENMKKINFANNKFFQTNKIESKISDKIIEIEYIEQQAYDYKFKIEEEERNFEISCKKDYEYILDKNLVTCVPLNKNNTKYELNFGLSSSELELIGLSKKYAYKRKLTKGEDESNVIMTPMPGKVVKILVEEGQEVGEGQTLVIVEAMKMQSEYKSSGKKRVKEILVGEGETIDGNQALIVLE